MYAYAANANIPCIFLVFFASTRTKVGVGARVGEKWETTRVNVFRFEVVIES